MPEDVKPQAETAMEAKTITVKVLMMTPEYRDGLAERLNKAQLEIASLWSVLKGMPLQDIQMHQKDEPKAGGDAT